MEFICGRGARRIGFECKKKKSNWHGFRSKERSVAVRVTAHRRLQNPLLLYPLDNNPNSWITERKRTREKSNRRRGTGWTKDQSHDAFHFQVLKLERRTKSNTPKQLMLLVYGELEAKSLLSIYRRFADGTWRTKRNCPKFPHNAYLGK